jgi:predicted transglutaminase-like cysteine proteinase
MPGMPGHCSMHTCHALAHMPWHPSGKADACCRKGGCCSPARQAAEVARLPSTRSSGLTLHMCAHAGVLGVGYVWYANVYVLPKVEYNALHPFTSWIPISCWIVLRNLTPGLRQWSLGALHPDTCQRSGKTCEEQAMNKVANVLPLRSNCIAHDLLSQEGQIGTMLPCVCMCTGCTGAVRSQVMLSDGAW